MSRKDGGIERSESIPVMLASEFYRYAGMDDEPDTADQINHDVKTAKSDLIASLIEMQLLPRLRYILEVRKLRCIVLMSTMKRSANYFRSMRSHWIC